MLDSIFWLIGAATFVFYIVCFLLIYTGDCDILMQITCRYGQPIASLRGKVVWITGASSGLGEHIAYELAKVGAKLVLSARREEELERVKKNCVALGGSAADEILILKLDLVNFDSHERATEQVIDHFKQIDILVNNAGVAQVGSWVKTTLDVADEVFKVNTFGPVSLTKRVLPFMIKRKSGHIVNVCSISGKIALPQDGPYSGSKHASLGWFKSLKIEALRENIQVTTIMPGLMFSNILKGAYTEELGKKLTNDIEPSENRLRIKRAAYLSSVAIANQVNEAWISTNPGLFYTYLTQYFPNLAFWFGRFLKSTSN